LILRFTVYYKNPATQLENYVRNNLYGVEGGQVGGAVYPNAAVRGNSPVTVHPYIGNKLNLAAYDDQTVNNKVWFFNDTEYPNNDPSTWQKDQSGFLTPLGSTANLTTTALVATDNAASLVAYLKSTTYTTSGTMQSDQKWWTDITLAGNVTVPSGVTLTLTSSATIDLNGFAITSSGGTITEHSGVSYSGRAAVRKAGSTIKGMYPSLSSALSDASSGQTVYAAASQNVASSLTVSSGIGLQVNSGVALTMSSGVRLNIYGTLNASGATFQGNGSAGYWNSISYYANSSGTVQSCTICDAQCGIYAATDASVSISDNTISNNSVYGISLNNSADNTISGCTIQNNGTGINIYSVNTTITGNSILNNTNYGINAEDVGAIYWEDNTIEGNGHGVVLENADPYFFNNIIANNGHGISIVSSSPYFGGPFEYGLNAITCAAVPLFRASSYSDVYMGYGGDGGYNSILGSEYPDMEAYTNSEISADYNYWASATPAVYADGTSEIYSDYPLSSDPTSGPSCLSKKSSSYAQSHIFNASEQDNDYWKGKEYFKNGDVISAKNSFKAVINGKYDDKYSPLALLSLYNLKKHFVEQDKSISEEFSRTLKDLYENENNSLKPFAIRILCKEAALLDNMAKVVSLNKELINKYSNTDHEISALYNLVTYYISSDNFTEAKKYYDQLKAKYPAEDLTKFAGINLGEKNNLGDNSKKNADESNKIQKEFLVEVYPNPFNPTTTIKYSLPVSSNVELKIYDIMGKEIRTLVAGKNQSGYKEVLWDGKNDNGSQVSSGIYLYRLVAKSLEDGKIFEKSAKMIMMK